MGKAFVLVAASITLVINACAADSAPATPGRDDAHKEERAKEAQKRRDEFNKLTPEQKEAKRSEFKARLEKRLSELRCKQTNGTLSSDEVRELSRREQLLKRFQQPSDKKTNAPSGPRP